MTYFEKIRTTCCIGVVFTAIMAVPTAVSAETVRLGLTNNPGDPAFEGATRLAEKVLEATDGRVEIKIFGNGELGNNQQLFNQVSSGAIEMAIVPFGVLADVVPEFTATLGGYFYDDWSELKRVLDAEDLGISWNQRLADTAGLEVLGVWFQGARQVTTTDKELRSPADFKGIKLRAVPNPISLATIRGLGANPTPVPFPELFGALRQGIVDGQENPVGTIASARFYEVQKNLILTGHQLQALPWLLNTRAWSKISDEDQATIKAVAQEVADWTSNYTIELEESLVSELEAKGMNIVRLSDDELAAFRASVQAETRKEFDGKIWPAGMIDAILALTK
uniref:TRAP transporter substrate-binding protein n=1 Tax=Pararhizobium sp. IMCC3301 TaxID=3067904 RepID=UPI0027406FF9|nr:TRAP transporter substrate-binding protein [Pararhizobium sp. IMCC3301]